jgi:hypothetical protein
LREFGRLVLKLCAGISDDRQKCWLGNRLRIRIELGGRSRQLAELWFFLSEELQVDTSVLEQAGRRH